MKQLDILYFNIAGLSTNYVALRQIVEEKRPFLIFLAETHIVDEDAFNQYSIPGYNVAACLSHSRHTGGVAIYVKESIQFELQFNEACEGNWFLGITVVRGMKMGNYGVLYHSPSSSDQRFIEILENWLDVFIDPCKLNVLAGDFNINWCDHNSNHLKRLAEFFNLKQKVTDCTRITQHSRTLIDHVYSNFDSVYSVRDCNLKITDHETLVINVEDNVSVNDNFVKIKCWRHYSKQAVSNLVERSMDSHYSSGNIDHKAAVLTNALKTSTNKLVEQKFVNIKNSNS